LLLILCCILFLTLLLIFCSSYQNTVLHQAARFGHPAVCELLISGKADLNAKNLCAFLHFDFVLYLHSTLLLIFCSSYQGTALHWAASYGYPAVCELLIASKADVNAKD
jgi:ankyrin repeat protein